MPRFEVISPFEPAGDQPQAIEELVEGIRDGAPYQTLMGATGTGKTFSMSKVIEAVQKAHTRDFPQQNPGGATLR